MAKQKMLILSQAMNPEFDPYRFRNTTGYDVPQWRYVVEEVKNSTTPCLMDNLTKEQADGYCAQEDWSVTIRHAKG